MGRNRLLEYAMLSDGRRGYDMRRDYARNDMARRDMNYDMRRDMDYEEIEFKKGRDMNRDYGSRYPFNVSGEFGRYDGGDYYGYDRNDYHHSEMSMRLDDRELMELSKKLLSKVEEKDKQFFTQQNIKTKAQNHGISFDYFSFEEFYVTILMVYTDYHKTIGSGNMDIYLKLAKDWLCDDDTAFRYGEKLAAYYDGVIKGMK